MAEAKILKCTCKTGQSAEYQDEKYGPGMRVHSPLKKGEKSKQQYRCCVCAVVREGPAAA